MREPLPERWADLIRYLNEKDLMLSEATERKKAPGRGSVDFKIRGEAHGGPAPTEGHGISRGRWLSRDGLLRPIARGSEVKRRMLQIGVLFPQAQAGDGATFWVNDHLYTE